MDLVERSWIKVVRVRSFQELWTVDVAWASFSVSVSVLVFRWGELLRDMVWL